MIIGLGSDFWGNALFTTAENMNRIDAEFILHQFKLLPVILSLLGSLSAFLVYSFGRKLLVQLKLSDIGRSFYNFFNKKWFFDKVYNECIGQFFFMFSYDGTYKTVDRGIIEIFGPMGLSSVVSRKAFYLNKLQSGYLYHYAFLILISITLMLGVRQFCIVTGNFIDYKISILFFIISFFILNQKETK